MIIEPPALGCDVSYCQEPKRVPWADQRLSFGIVKATEGVSRDRNAVAHAEAIRAAGKVLGAYHFFRPDMGSRDQFEALDAAALAMGYGKPGDLVPAIDVEYYRGHEVKPTWCGPLRAFAELLTEAFSAPPLIYCSQSTWVCLGRPAWLLQYPLWVPLYVRDGRVPPKSLAPRYVPGGGDWAIWQHYVGPLFGTIQDTAARGAVDHNLAKQLPRIT